MSLDKTVKLQEGARALESDIPDTLEVSCTLTIDDPAGKLEKYFSSPFELYDHEGTEVIKRDNEITLFDILASNMVNSRVDTGEKISIIWGNRAPMEEALAHIPPNASLLSEAAPWDELEDLLRVALATRHVGLAVATKILHKKRPELIPMIDSVVGGYYRDVYSDVTERGLGEVKRAIRMIRHFREELQRCRTDLEKLSAIAKERGCNVTLVRILEVLVWIEREPRGQFRNIVTCTRNHDGKVPDLAEAQRVTMAQRDSRPMTQDAPVNRSGAPEGGVTSYGVVWHQVRQSVHDEDRLRTPGVGIPPSKQVPFWIGQVAQDYLTINVGKSRTRMKLPAEVFEEVVRHLRSHLGTLRAAALHTDAALEGSVDEVVRQVAGGKTARGNYVAAILEHTGLVESVMKSEQKHIKLRAPAPGAGA